MKQRSYIGFTAIGNSEPGKDRRINVPVKKETATAGISFCRSPSAEWENQTADSQTANNLTLLQEFQVLSAVNILKLKLIPHGYPAYPPGIFFD